MTELENLKRYNKKLAEKLKPENAAAINQFIKKHETRGSSPAHIEKLVSDFSKIQEKLSSVNLQNPTVNQINQIIAAVNQNRVTKNNGEPYSEWSKDTINKTLSNYLKLFGHQKIWEQTESINANPEVKVEPDKIPKPQHIKKAVETADNIRDKAFILFGWSTGARIGEITVTSKDPEPLKWKHIKFKEDFMTVKISESGTGSRGKKPEERVIPVKFSMHLMKEYYNNQGFNLEDPVFAKMRTKLDQEYEPLTEEAARKILEKWFDKAEIPEKISRNPHDVFRKSCAIYWAYVGWSEYKLRQYFGWSKNSDAPNHYIEVTQEGLEKALMEAFGEKYDSGFEEDLLKPVECTKCGNPQSPVFSYCRECGQELSEELKIHNQGNTDEIKLDAKLKDVLELAEELGVDLDDIG